MPISTTGNKPRRGNRLGPLPRQSGFTLLELLFVLVIVGLSGALVINNIGRLASRSSEMSQVDNVVRELKRARVQAILSGLPNRVELQYAAGTIVPARQGQAPLQLPARYAIQANDAAGLPIEAQGIVFYPDGSATQALFLLSTPSYGSYEIRVHGLSGRVESHPVAAS